jgi:flagellar hook-associated protein 3 FlgL
MTSSIIGIPTNRISDQFVRERLLDQVQYNQSQMMKAQTQLSTGHRFETPSDDPVAAARVASLQQLLSRKAQMTTNITTSQSYISASDTALSNISDLLAEARGDAIGVMGSTASDTQRQATALQIQQVLNQLVDTSNSQFRGRYLFAGSDSSSAPFQASGNNVKYSGNKQSLSSYADLDQLFKTNVDGDTVFGAISDGVLGGNNLLPQVTVNTRLSDLNGGSGVRQGSIALSDGNTTSIIDLSKAETLGDAIALIEANPPDGRKLDVGISNNGLWLQLEPAVGLSTNLSIREAGKGTTAAELGILHESGVGDNPILGSDLKPKLTLTTSLDDILGGQLDRNSGLQIVNSGNTYNINFSTSSTVEDLLNTINGAGAGVLAEINDDGTGIDVHSIVSGCDFSIGENGGTTASQLGLRTFNYETQLKDLNHGRGVDDYKGDTDSGADFHITRSDGVDLPVNITGTTTIGDIIVLINNLPGNEDGALTARLARNGNGIELVDNSGGSGQLTVTKSTLSNAAVDLGLVPEGATSNSAQPSAFAQTLTGRDVNPQETKSIFTALVRMQTALQNNDSLELQRAIDMLDQKTTDLNSARAELGVRQQGLETLQQRQETENTQLKQIMSADYDVDMAQAISDFTAMQYSFEAALKATAMIFQMTLLNYL